MRESLLLFVYLGWLLLLRGLESSARLKPGTKDFTDWRSILVTFCFRRERVLADWPFDLGILFLVLFFPERLFSFRARLAMPTLTSLSIRSGVSALSAWIFYRPEVGGRLNVGGLSGE